MVKKFCIQKPIPAKGALCRVRPPIFLYHWVRLRIGRVEFKPNAARFINNGTIVGAKTYEFDLDDQGSLNRAAGVALARNGSAAPAGGYTVTEFIEGLASYTYILLDSAGPVDLSTLS